MESDRQLSASARWIAAGLVAAVLLVILGIKVARAPAAARNLPTAEARSAATLPAMGATSAASSTESTQIKQQMAPLPTEPAAQLEWVLRYSKPAMILFHSTNCKPCLVMMDIVQRIRTDFEAQIVFIDVVTNERSNAELVRQAQIRSIPTSVFITASGEGYGFIGVMEEEELLAELTKLTSEEE